MTFAQAPPTAAPPTPSADMAPYSIAYRVSAFTFQDGDGEPKPSRVDGELLAQEITGAWQERGLIGKAELAAPEAKWPGDHFYAFTFSGSQRNDSGFWPQGFNTLTLFLLPYSVTHHYDMVCVARNVLTGREYTATVRANDETWVTLPFLFALPFYEHGHSKELAVAADRLYEALAKQGAFD